MFGLEDGLVVFALSKLSSFVSEVFWRMAVGALWDREPCYENDDSDFSMQGLAVREIEVS